MWYVCKLGGGNINFNHFVIFSFVNWMNNCSYFTEPSPKHNRVTHRRNARAYMLETRGKKGEKKREKEYMFMRVCTYQR